MYINFRKIVAFYMNVCVCVLYSVLPYIPRIQLFCHSVCVFSQIFFLYFFLSLNFCLFERLQSIPVTPMCLSHLLIRVLFDLSLTCVCFAFSLIFVYVCACFHCCFVYKKYGVTCCDGITRSVSGTALKMIGLRSLEVLKSNIEATFPQR